MFCFSQEGVFLSVPHQINYIFFFLITDNQPACVDVADRRKLPLIFIFISSFNRILFSIQHI